MNQINLKIILLIVPLCIVSIGFSQERTKLEWSINHEHVINQDKVQNKPVLCFFHGSDWCRPCMKIQKKVLDNQVFIDLASETILFTNIDYTYKYKLSDKQLKHNNQLKKISGLPDEFTQGYPQLVIINQNAKLLNQEKGYNGEGTEKPIKTIIAEM